MKLKIEVEIEELSAWTISAIDEALDNLRGFGEIKLAKLEDLPSEITLEES